MPSLDDLFEAEIDLEEDTPNLEPDFEEEPEDPTANYWWKTGDEEDSSALASELQGRSDTYENFVRTSRYFNWCRQSWSAYYGQAYDDAGSYYDLGTVALGDEGELVGAQINHHRNLIRHLFNLVTKDRPALRCRARNSDLKSLRQADLGNGLVEYYLRQEQAEIYTTNAVEHALVLAEGFVTLTWDPSLGEEIDADPTTLRTIHKGDLSFHNPFSWNVIRDLGVREWAKHQWIGVRSPRNKWNLVAQFPESSEAILNAAEWTDVPLEEGDQPFDEHGVFTDTDEVEVYEFWHKRTTALPEGRYVLMVGGEIVHEDVMPYRDLPVHRVTASELLITPFGYTPAFDLIGIQELINMCVSTISTIINALGVPTLWKKLGSHLQPSSIAGGLTLLESEEKPEALDLMKVPSELFSFLDRLIRHAEIVAGIDQITRGAPDEHVRSGAYAALLQAQSVQFSSSLVRSYNQLLESIGTSMLRMLRDFAQTERVVTIMGKHNRIYQKHFTGDDLDLIDRVTVESVNPVMNTVSGKMEFAQMLLQAKDSSGNPLISTPEEILHVFQTGQVEPMLQAETSMLSSIREENEQFLDGEEVAPPMATDNHVLHLREHFSIFGTKETRNDPNLRSSVQAHAMEHLELLLENPNAQLMQQMLGYEHPIPPGAVVDGAGPGSAAAPPPPEPLNPEDLTAAPEPMNPELDGRSVAKIPQPSVPPGA